MQLQIKPYLIDEIKEYVKQSRDEIGGLGTIIFDDKSGDATLESLYMVKQKVHAATCELDPTDISRIMNESFQKEDKGQLIFWWHSHVNMGVSPSGQDDTTMQQIGSAGQCIAMIINKKGEVSARYYQRCPRLTVGIEVAILKPANPELEAKVKNDLDTLVSPLYPTHMGTTKYESRQYPFGFYNDAEGYSGYRDEGFSQSSRRSLHQETRETTGKTTENQPTDSSKAEKGVVKKTIEYKGTDACRKYFRDEWHRRILDEVGLSNEVFLDYTDEKGANPTDMEQLINFYIDKRISGEMYEI